MPKETVPGRLLARRWTALVLDGVAATAASTRLLLRRGLLPRDVVVAVAVLEQRREAAAAIDVLEEVERRRRREAGVAQAALDVVELKNTALSLFCELESLRASRYTVVELTSIRLSSSTVYGGRAHKVTVIELNKLQNPMSSKLTSTIYC